MTINSRTTNHPRVLVDSGTDPDEIRTYFEVPQALYDRLTGTGPADAAFVELLQALLDEHDAAQASESGQIGGGR